MVTQEQAQHFADEWFAAWNAHDLDAILSHYADYITFTSPFVVALIDDPTGTIHGKEALRAYFARGLAAYPDLHFEPMHALYSVGSVTLVYRSVKNLIAAEVMLLDAEAKVNRVFAHYTAA